MGDLAPGPNYACGILERSPKEGIGNLSLDFNIENFWGFKKLSLEKLGRVNLIVGKNSVGKSSVLQAFRIYASGADARVPCELSIARSKNLLFRIYGPKSPTVHG